MSVDGLREFLRDSKCLSDRKLKGENLTTYAIGGEIDFLLEPRNSEDLRRLIGSLSSQKISYKIIGAGSNLLIATAGIRHPVIKLSKAFNYIEKVSGNENVFKVGAAAALMNVSRQLSSQGYSGLEFAGGIPASLGGAVRMNAGAHKGQMSDVIDSVEIVTSQGEAQVVPASQIDFSYRHCSLPLDVVIEAVFLRLIPGDKDNILAERAKNLEYRKLTQPLTLPSSGSVFKNPSPELPAGRLIEELGFKGYSSGGAEVSTMHANWIVNPLKSANSSDVIKLIEQIKVRAQAEKGVSLREELVYWE